MNRSIFDVKLFGKNFKVSLVETKYVESGSTAILVKEPDSAPYLCKLSVNINASAGLPDGAFFARHWSENEGLVEQLLEQRAIELVEGIEPQKSGVVENIRAYRLVKD